MKTVCELNKCNGCMACADRCPKNCIKIEDQITAMNAVIDEKSCVNCKACEKVCPNVSFSEANKPISWFQGWAEASIRNSSTSGGAAASIVKSFIKNGGYVASCLFMDGQFRFKITNDLVTARRFAGSKYVKSGAAGIYKEIEERTKTDKVLFIGLPCQVAAVKNFVKNTTNLYTIDIICHGTPSVQLLKQFLKEDGIDLSELADIKFRKKIGAKADADRKNISLSRAMDAYTCTFLRSVNYTENCYSCGFAKLDRVSDITLGDSWGSEFKNEESKGISLILCQTEKGKELIQGTDMELHPVDLETAVRNNHQLVGPAQCPPERTKFLRMLGSGKKYKVSTLQILPKMMIKQQIKELLLALHVKKDPGDYGITIIKK